MDGKRKPGMKAIEEVWSSELNGRKGWTDRCRKMLMGIERRAVAEL